MGRKHFTFLALAATAAAFASPARADFTFNLTTGNSALNGFAGPYASVDVHLVDTTHATITFTGLSSATNAYLMGDGGTVGVNINASSWNLSISGSNSFAGFTPGAYSDGGAGNEDGFGSFNQTVNTFDGYTHSSTQVVLSLTDTGGTWADDTKVLTGNSNGDLAAAHIFVCASLTCNTDVSALTTGFATSNGSSSGGSSSGGGGGGGGVPEPATVLLLGAGLVAAGVARRRVAKSA